MPTTTVTRNFQITLPKEIREIEHIHVGDRLSVSWHGRIIELHKFSAERVLSCFGVWKSKENSVGMIRKIRDEAEQRLGRLGL